jgi:hypothetical protein
LSCFPPVLAILRLLTLYKVWGKFLFSNNTGKDFLNINAFTQQYGFGDISSAGSGSQLQIDDLNELMQLLVGADPYLFLDVINDSFSIGDINGATSSTYFYLDGTQSEISTGADSVFTTEHNVGRYRLGDLSSTKNSSLLQLNDNATLEFLYSVAGNKYLDLSPSNFTYKIGDIDAANHHTTLVVDDQIAVQQILAGALNGIKITGDTTYYIQEQIYLTVRVFPWEP